MFPCPGLPVFAHHLLPVRLPFPPFVPIPSFYVSLKRRVGRSVHRCACSLLELAVRSFQRMSSPANGTTAVALIQPSPFDVLPAPPLRARYLRNQRRLQRLSLERLSGQTEAGLQWEAEVARQLGDEGFVVLDGFLGAEGAAQVRAAVVSALESAATAGGLAGGALRHAELPRHCTPRRTSLAPRTLLGRS